MPSSPLSRSVFPTGYSAFDLPFYSDLDHERFEQFCTELLNLHPAILCLRNGKPVTRTIIEAKRLLSGTAQRGVDIRADADGGEVWFFQCKHVQAFSPGEVSEAVALAEEGFPQADQFVLITTCGLSERAQAALDKKDKWRAWDASRLTIELLKLTPREGAINLVHRYFGSQRAKEMFLCGDQLLHTWREFFARDLSPESRNFHHRTSFVEHGDTITCLESFAERGAGRALIFSGQGGQGKSKLLLELAQRLESKPAAPRIRFLNLNHHGLTSDQSDWLAREQGELLLVIDDAHRLDAALQDVVRSAAKAPRVSLLVVTRPHAREWIRSLLYRNGYSEKLEEDLRLPAWREEDMVALAESVLEPRYKALAPRLAGLADRCPLLVVLGAALVNSGHRPESLTGQEAFRERVFRSFEDDVLSHQPEGKRERVRRLIRCLSFVSPTPRKAFLEKASEILGSTSLEIDEDLSSLQAAGLVVENSEGLRLYPDLFADAVLLDACLDQRGRASVLCETVLSKLSIAEFPAVMRNVAQADWEARSRRGAQCSLFDPIWNRFLEAFTEGKWLNKKASFTERVLDYLANPQPDPQIDRSQLLGQWASFAAFLPERTLELAVIALRSVDASSQFPNEASPSRTEESRELSSSLPPLLKPVVIWHHQHAERALDILWSLEANQAPPNWEDSSNAVNVIAEAAAFGFEKPLQTSETVMSWLEKKLQECASLERVQKQPWILSALLKPFLGRSVECSWATGKTAHFTSRQVNAGKTRPLRQRALAIASRFLNGNDRVLRHAIVPVIDDAVHPVGGRSRLTLSETELETWRPDRLAVVQIMEKAIETRSNDPLVLLQLRQVLRKRSQYDPDKVVRKESRRVLSQIQDTFELRVLRALTSWTSDEVVDDAGPGADTAREGRDKGWLEFRQSVARELVERFSTAEKLCEFLRQQIRDLGVAGLLVGGGALLDEVAELSPAWCAAVLQELVRTTNPALAGSLSSVLRLAATTAPDTHRQAVEGLTAHGHAEQLRSLINYAGWKHLHGGGLAEYERRALLQLTERREDEVVCALASVAGLHFANEPRWAMDLLGRLKPASECSGCEMVRALAQLSKMAGTALDLATVAQCLQNLGEFILPTSFSHDYSVDEIGKRSPKQLYEHVRDMCLRAEADGRRPRGHTESLALGKIDDSEYVDREIRTLWEKAVLSRSDYFAQLFRLDLIRALLWADASNASGRLKGLIEGCDDGEQLQLVTKLAAVPGSHFVFQFHDLVRLLLTQSERFGILNQVTQQLWLSACGGGRTFTNDELDPEYRYILEQAHDLATRYRDDPVLSRFYGMIAEYERRQHERDQRRFREEDELQA